MKIFGRRKSGFIHETLKDQSSFGYDTGRVPSTLPTSDDSSFDSEEFPRIPQIRLQQDGELREMRKVLDEVGVFRKCRASKKTCSSPSGIGSSGSSLSKTGWKPASKEPVWKRRLRNVRSPIIGGRKKDDDNLKNTIVSVQKSVSWDDEFPRNGSPREFGSAGETSKNQQRKGRKGEKKVVDRGPSFKREGSSFSDFIRFVADQDMFSLQTPSYFSEATSAASGNSVTPTASETSGSVTDAYTDEITEIDDDSTISSYPRYRRRRRRRSRRSGESESRGESHRINMFGCRESDSSLAEDFRLFAELVLKDASCSTCFSEPSVSKSRR